MIAHGVWRVIRHYRKREKEAKRTRHTRFGRRLPVVCDPSLQEETKRPDAPGDGRHCRLTPTIQAMIVCRARRARDARGADGASDPRRHQSPPGVTMSTRTVIVSETRVAFCRTAGKAMTLDVFSAKKNNRVAHHAPPPPPPPSLSVCLSLSS